MKHKLKGKMVKTKRDKFSAFHNIQFTCKTCYWEGSGKDVLKDKGYYVCPNCEDVLDSYIDWELGN